MWKSSQALLTPPDMRVLTWMHYLASEITDLLKCYAKFVLSSVQKAHDFLLKRLRTMALKCEL